MRKRFALSAVSIGILVACGPHDVDLGGGSGGQGTGGDGISTGGVGGSFTTGGVGGAYATGGTGGDEANCSNGLVEFPEVCDDGGEPGGCPDDCGVPHSTGGAGGVGGAYVTGGTGGSPEQYCGDGVVQYPEVCDDPGDEACPVDCGVAAGVGGTGAVGGSDGSGGYGGTGAFGGVGVGGGPSESVCGNGIVEPGENCDDGNVADGDGCSADCWYVEGGTGGTGAGGTGTGGGPAQAGMAGQAGNANCSTDVVQAPEGECSDNDVLFGRAYERCMAAERSLVAVRFTNPCGEYSSYSMEVDCCDRSAGSTGGAGGVGGAGGGGGRAGSSAGGVGGSG